MGLQINTNVAAMNAYRNLASTQNALSTSLQRLSSGLRINSAADDAAGLAISQKLQGQISGLQQASQNAQDGISLLQTAEGALNESQSILQRMRQLAVQSANDTNTSTDRANIQKEVTQLVGELDRIRNTTQFNTKNLLDGSFSGAFQIGANAGQSLTVTVGDMGATALGVAGATPKGVAADGAVGTVGGGTAPTGAYTLDGTNVLDGNGSVVGAYDDTTKVATFNSDNGGATVTFDKTAYSDTTGLTGSFSVSSAVDVSTSAGANAAISTIDTAVDSVSGQRADLGAYENRLQHTVNNLGVAAENLTASKSRITDTDMAQEMTSFTRAQILQQAGVSMLAQANQMPQAVLKLLG